MIIIESVTIQIGRIEEIKYKIKLKQISFAARITLNQLYLQIPLIQIESVLFWINNSSIDCK